MRPEKGNMNPIDVSLLVGQPIFAGQPGGNKGKNVVLSENAWQLVLKKQTQHELAAARKGVRASQSKERAILRVGITERSQVKEKDRGKGGAKDKAKAGKKVIDISDSSPGSGGEDDSEGSDDGGEKRRKRKDKGKVKSKVDQGGAPKKKPKAAPAKLRQAQELDGSGHPSAIQPPDFHIGLAEAQLAAYGQSAIGGGADKSAVATARLENIKSTLDTQLSMNERWKNMSRVAKSMATRQVYDRLCSLGEWGDEKKARWVDWTVAQRKEFEVRIQSPTQQPVPQVLLLAAALPCFAGHILLAPQALPCSAGHKELEPVDCGENYQACCACFHWNAQPRTFCLGQC